MTNTTEKKKPLAAYHVRDGKDDAKSFWTRIGSAWAHQDGDGFTVRLDCIPANGRIVIRQARTESRKGGAA